MALTTAAPRNFAAELAAARTAGDWAAHERIWDERRVADVDADEASLAEVRDEWAAEDALATKAYRAEDLYSALIVELTAIEDRITADRRGARRFDPVYLTDTNNDHANAIDAGHAWGTLGFWEACLSYASSDAGSRAEAEGIDLNAEAGRTIY
jgi:hypothetical protein